MKRLIVAAPVLVLALSACAAEETLDPMTTCIDVLVDYGIAEARSEAAEFCVWLGDHEGQLGGRTFEETFSDLDLAREWAEAEIAKEG